MSQSITTRCPSSRWADNDCYVGRLNDWWWFFDAQNTTLHGLSTKRSTNQLVSRASLLESAAIKHWSYPAFFTSDWLTDLPIDRLSAPTPWFVELIDWLKINPTISPSTWSGYVCSISCLAIKCAPGDVILLLLFHCWASRNIFQRASYWHRHPTRLELDIRHRWMKFQLKFSTASDSSNSKSSIDFTDGDCIFIDSVEPTILL